MVTWIRYSIGQVILVSRQERAHGPIEFGQTWTDYMGEIFHILAAIYTEDNEITIDF